MQKAKFLGSYECKVDAKARISIPANFRHQENFDQVRFLMSPSSPCLIVHYPYEEGSELESLSVIFARACEPDSAGRIVLDEQLRDHLKVEKHQTVTFVGMGNHAQIWSTENWQRVEPQYRERLEKAIQGAGIWLPAERK